MLALDAAPSPLEHGPDAYVGLAGNLLPGWTLSLLALALLLRRSASGARRAGRAPPTARSRPRARSAGSRCARCRFAARPRCWSTLCGLVGLIPSPGVPVRSRAPRSLGTGRHDRRRRSPWRWLAAALPAPAAAAALAARSPERGARGRARGRRPRRRSASGWSTPTWRCWSRSGCRPGCSPPPALGPGRLRGRRPGRRRADPGAGAVVDLAGRFDAGPSVVWDLLFMFTGGQLRDRPRAARLPARRRRPRDRRRRPARPAAPSAPRMKLRDLVARGSGAESAAPRGPSGRRGRRRRSSRSRRRPGRQPEPEEEPSPEPSPPRSPSGGPAHVVEAAPARSAARRRRGATAPSPSVTTPISVRPQPARLDRARAASSRRSARQRRQQLVVLAAPKRQLERRASAPATSSTTPGGERHPLAARSRAATAARAGEVPGVRAEAVADVDHRGRARRGQRAPGGEPRPRVELAVRAAPPAASPEGLGVAAVAPQERAAPAAAPPSSPVTTTDVAGLARRRGSPARRPRRS